VMVSTEAWEQDGIDRRIYVYGAVHRDSQTGQFRMWYNRNHLVMQATSEDGLHWQRPASMSFPARQTRTIIFSSNILWVPVRSSRRTSFRHAGALATLGHQRRRLSRQGGVKKHCVLPSPLRKIRLHSAKSHGSRLLHPGLLVYLFTL
jgi:hypothetical protein